MKRYFLLIVITFLSLQGFTKQINPEDYVQLTLKTINESGILLDRKIDTLFINSNGIPYSVADTTINSTHLIFTVSKTGLFFWKAKFWFETTKFDFSGKHIDYGFCVNSWKELENLKYVSGFINYKKTKDGWKLDKKKVNQVNFSELPKIENPLVKPPPPKRRHDLVRCYHFNLKKTSKRRFNTLADTLIGNWYSTADSSYSEYLFTGDSIYIYDIEMVGSIPLRPAIYDIENGLLIIKNNAEKLTLSIDIININTIHLHGTGTIQLDNTKSLNRKIDFVIHRIPDSEFTFSDIKCWKEITKKDGGYKYCRDRKKFIKGFMKRRYKVYKNYALQQRL